MSSAVADDTTLVMTRTFDAPPERVFNAWLDHDQFQAWIGPEGMQCEVPVMEARVGGRYEIKMRMSTGQILPVSGVFKTIEPPKRLVFTWGWENDADRQSLITLTFRAVGNKTEMTLKQEGLATVESRNSHEEGWGSTFTKLARYVKTGAV